MNCLFVSAAHLKPENSSSGDSGKESVRSDAVTFVKTNPGSAGFTTPTKSAGKATVGFVEDEVQKPTPPSSPASTKKSRLKLKVQNDSVGTPSSLVKDPKKSGKGVPSNTGLDEKDNKSYSKTSVTTDEDVVSSTTAVDSNLRNAVEFMGLEGDKEVIQASAEAVRPVTATPKSK